MADRSVLVRIRGDASSLIRATGLSRAAIAGLGKEIDKTNDRTAWMAQSFMALGPALVPLGASAVPVLAGLAAQMTVAGTAAVATVLAFNGIGDATKALNEYQLEPTTANFEKLQQAMDKLGPTGEEFVRFLDSVGPQFSEIQMAARDGMFPGMAEGIENLLDLLPQLEDIIFNVSQGIGELAADAGAGLSGEGFADFFDYLETDAKPILIDMGHTIGNFAEGLANMLVAFAPTSASFTTGMREMSQSFVDWTDSLGESEAFTSFLDYVEQSGPKILDLFGSLVNAFLEIAEAAAPVGDIMVPALSALLDIIAGIAGTPFGTMFIGAAAAMGLYGRAAALASITTGGLSKALFGNNKAFKENIKGANGMVARMQAIRTASGVAAGALGMFALSMTDMDEKAGLSNTAMGAMIGTMVSPGWGTAIGAGIGGIKDLAAANDELEDAITRADRAISTMSTAALRQARDDLKGLLEETKQGSTFGAFIEDITHVGDDSNFGSAMMNNLTGATGKAKVELSGVKDALAGVGTVADGMAGPLGLTGRAFHFAAMSAEEFSAAVSSAFALLDKRASLRAARAAVREFTKVLKDAPDEMEKGGPAYDKVEEALDNIARSSLEAAENLKGMGRVNFIDQMRDQFIKSAEAMGMTSKEAGRLATQLGLLDKTQANPNLDANTKPLRGKLNEANNFLAAYGRQSPTATLGADNKPARGKIDETNNWLEFLGGRRVDSTIGANTDPWWSAVNQVNSYHIPDKYVQIRAINNVRTHGAFADGGTVPGQRIPYADKITILAAPGEEIITNRNGEADRFRADRDAGRIPRYADGGTIAARAAASAPQVSVAAPQLSLAGARFVFEVPGMGQLTTRVVRAEMAADQTYHARLDDRP